MPSALSTYGFISAKLKTRMSRRLPSDLLEAMIRAKSLPEAVLLLRGSAYAAVEEAYTATGDLRASEALMNRRELELYTDLFKFLHEPVLAFVGALSMRFEIEKLKHALRLWFDAVVRGRSIEGKTGYLYRPRIVHDFDVDRLILATDVEGIVEALSRTPYALMAARELPGAVESHSLYNFELALDHYYYEQLFAAAAALPAKDRRLAERSIGVDIDVQNITWLLRSRSMPGTGSGGDSSWLIPGGLKIQRAELLSAFEVQPGAGRGGSGRSPAADELLRKISPSVALLDRGGEAGGRLWLLEAALRQVSQDEASRSLLGNPFSIGVIMAYFIRKREELRTVMTVLNAKSLDLSEARIRSAI